LEIQQTILPIKLIRAWSESLNDGTQITSSINSIATRVLKTRARDETQRYVTYEGNYNLAPGTGRESSGRTYLRLTCTSPSRRHLFCLRTCSRRDLSGAVSRNYLEHAGVAAFSAFSAICLGV